MITGLGGDIDATAKRHFSSERADSNPRFVATLKDLELSTIPSRTLRSTTNLQDAERKFTFGHEYTFQQQNKNLRTPTKSRDVFKTHLSPLGKEIHEQHL